MTLCFVFLTTRFVFAEGAVLLVLKVSFLECHKHIQPPLCPVTMASRYFVKLAF